MNELIVKKTTSALTFEQVIPIRELQTIRSYMNGEEGSWFKKKVLQINQILQEVPQLGQQDGQGDNAIVFFHYFNAFGSGDWWITEIDPVFLEAFGYADLGEPELGYIALSELVQLPTVELDLHWNRKTLGEVRKGRR